MIGVLLFLLKCIGILLLALVCLLLLITLVVLLAPIRYEAGGEKTDAIRADGQIKWLFVQVVARWQMGDKEPFVDLLIFGKSLLEKKKTKAKAARKKRKKPRPQKEGDLIYTREKAAPPKDTPPRPVMEQEVPKEVVKEEVIKEEIPKKEPPKEEIRKEEIPKEEPPKAEPPKEEIPKEEPKESKKEPNTVRPMQKKQGMRRVRLEDIEEEKPAEPKAEDIPDDLDEAFFTGGKRRKAPVETASGGGGQKRHCQSLVEIHQAHGKGHPAGAPDHQRHLWYGGPCLDRVSSGNGRHIERKIRRRSGNQRGFCQSYSGKHRCAGERENRSRLSPLQHTGFCLGEARTPFDYDTVERKKTA